VASGELEREPGIDRAEGGAAGVDAAGPEQPLDLRPGEVGVEDEPGALAKERLVAGGAQLFAAVGGAAVLPDERALQRRAGAPVPGHDRLALVGDPDCAQGGPVDARLGESSRSDRARGLPDLVGVVLDPARAREVLLELGVGAPGERALGVEDDARRAGRALVDREDHRRET
jgi:hypothetical protein